MATQPETQLETEQGIVRVPTGTWKVDPAHSAVEFQVKHMMIATVRGRFTEFEGAIEAAPDIDDSRAYGTVEVASIDTNQPDRDAHLRSPDFFDVERYTKIRFESKRIVPLGGARFRVAGDLTIKDVTREAELEATVHGAARDPYGNDRVGVSWSGAIDRREFGLKWQQVLETGGFLVGDEVKVMVDISAVKAPDG
jgi:polyisoprenoid-binding protein YceI